MKRPYKAIKDKDENIFKKCPNLTYNPLGFKEVKRYFVDNSGFGSETEIALTANQFLNKIKKGNYYAITSCGKFQVYVSEYVKDNQADTPKGYSKNAEIESRINQRQSFKGNSCYGIKTSTDYKIFSYSTLIYSEKDNYFNLKYYSATTSKIQRLIALSIYKKILSYRQGEAILKDL